MNLPAQGVEHIPSMSVEAVSRVRQLENLLGQCEEVPIITHHLIHAGVYARTITVRAGVVLTAALIKRSTILIVNGDATVATGENGGVRLTGYHVIPAGSHRKQAVLAHADTQITMIFASDASTIKDAEDEFTDEADLLLSRRGENLVNITGE